MVKTAEERNEITGKTTKKVLGLSQLSSGSSGVASEWADTD